ncbi:hypothetical protein EJ05DRAFT_490424 [Pseudovirgaria hyperparasitica]|uniref:mRNA decay factor PAT1 domain-containing protein n=1 Tax=Pseudovirgaria hyperparasitica TaxID=470096 RepID=A0A6A6VT02_9PEZI|nr:uncharacterized protein EJ05DRAFT_490424 [Pseudovirgaria hyperparasitica]KAF2753009.1 hypothetical protein EJ05DRAFT_490424 [Pseudovirgaria hyperparasitica]
MAFFGFSQPNDPFAGLSGRPDGDDDALNFEDTYDGLGDQLDETDDAFNDDTFGSAPATQQNIGKDFDFSGQTAKISTTLQEEQMLYTARQPPPKAKPTVASKGPSRTGYERYVDPGYIPALEANASIWGVGPKKPEATVQERPDQSAGAHGSSRKMMSLEEVEAAMRSQSKKPVSLPDAQVSGSSSQMYEQQWHQQIPTPQQQLGVGEPAQILQRPHPPNVPMHPQFHQSLPQHGQPEFAARSQPSPQTQILQRQKPVAQDNFNRVPAPPHTITRAQPQSVQQQPQPRQILQNPQRLSGQGQPLSQHGHGFRQAEMHRAPPTGPSHGRVPSHHAVVTHPEQLLQLSEEDRAAFLVEDAKRAKRNHKILMLSRDNGLMTPQDKNFITRIQLQQLVTATGGVDDQGPEAALAEDFYYQVYSQIRGAPRQNPHQPASQFAQTYLFQTGGRYGPQGRRHPRGGDNHIQRMEQQVQRAVEAAKAKPKNKQLVIEGSLGKISFSNSKTPKPLLNIKRPDTSDMRQQLTGRQASRPENSPIADRRQVLRNIEGVYATLMRLEDHERHSPPHLNDSSDPSTIQEHKDWQQRLQSLNQSLWHQLKVMEPINPNSPTAHPFVAMLSHPKGKKAIPRVFRHIDNQQRLTILTMIVVHMDSLDVIAQAVPITEEPASLSRMVKEEVELFAQTVIPSVFGHINESPLGIITGLLGLVLERTNIPLVARTKIGLSLLTILISRAELLKQSNPEIDPAEWKQWMVDYDSLFDTLEPYLSLLFTTAINDAEDVYVWQFLAAMGVGASPEQQQRLVIGVKDRVMETVKVSRALPQEMASVRLGHVNLFMRAIGLDVDLLG